MTFVKFYRALSFAGISSFIFGTERNLWACATCGLNESFSPKMLLISTGFVILPASFAGFIAWRVYKDNKGEKK